MKTFGNHETEEKICCLGCPSAHTKWMGVHTSSVFFSLWFQGTSNELTGSAYQYSPFKLINRGWSIYGHRAPLRSSLTFHNMSSMQATASSWLSCPFTAMHQKHTTYHIVKEQNWLTNWNTLGNLCQTKVPNETTLKWTAKQSTAEPRLHVPWLCNVPHFTTNSKGPGEIHLDTRIYNLGLYDTWLYDILHSPTSCCGPTLVRQLRYTGNQTAPRN